MPGVAPAQVLIIGGGVVGLNAAQMAVGLQADVTILDRDPNVIEKLSLRFGSRARVIYSTKGALQEFLPQADLVIGAVLIPGAAAPKLVDRNSLKEMKHGSVLVDVAIDQGGCFETSKPTTHADPTYVVDGVVHYCVANMPGAVPQPSTYALNNATLRHVLNIAKNGWKTALQNDTHLAEGLNVAFGEVTHRSVAESQQLGYTPVHKLLSA